MTPTRGKSKSAATKPKAGPSEVAPGVFVGGWKDAESFVGTRFCVLDERPEELDEMPGTTHVPIYDDGSEAPVRANLDRLASLVEAAHGRKEPVLLFCGHGVRRSPLAGAWYLHRSESLPLDEAFARVKTARPGIEHVKEWAKGWRTLEEPDTRASGTAGSKR
ncbi:MAG: dual specificity protein phosphatase family protein [Thermoplasmata archaeon]|nr:dual specificity protein phosphatase family protein [Thermoplasmata archaeon]